MIILTLIFFLITCVIGYLAIRSTPAFLNTPIEQAAEHRAAVWETGFWIMWVFTIVTASSPFLRG